MTKYACIGGLFLFNLGIVGAIVLYNLGLAVSILNALRPCARSSSISLMRQASKTYIGFHLA